ADVVAKCPKLPPPASQMHLGPKGELLTQQEFILGGGPDERPAPIPAEQPAATSGRHKVAALAGPAPLAAAPKPAPIAGDGGPVINPVATGKES
ncbi:MAG: hypothetical protein L6R48_08270, partial [Planctomycetes bacterium]|nr:hypothetical protein [Planctomycetota bacterium]